MPDSFARFSLNLERDYYAARYSTTCAKTSGQLACDRALNELALLNQQLSACDQTLKILNDEVDSPNSSSDSEDTSQRSLLNQDDNKMRD